jgi:predicted nucleic acid-binding protein
MQRDDALKYYRRGMAFVTVSDFVPEPLSIFNLVVRGQCSAYDAEFVALAEHLGVRLVTADKALIRAFPDVTTDLAQIAT